MAIAGAQFSFTAWMGACILQALSQRGILDHQCFSSLMGHFALLSQAVSWLQDNNHISGSQHSVVWREEQIKRFLVEMFDAWSLPNNIALDRLKTIYGDKATFYGKVVPFTQIYRERSSFAAKWPQRNYRIEPDSLSIDCNAADSDRFCTASLIVDWNVSNPDGGQRSGRSQYDFNLSVGLMVNGMGGDWENGEDPPPPFGVSFPPYISEESGHIISRN